MFVQVAGDVVDEIDETFELALSNPVNTSVVGGTGVATINDDDAQPSLSIDNVAVSEGDSGTTIQADFIVSLSAVSGRTVTVDYATVEGGAVTPDDFASDSGTLTFTAGELTKTVSVVVKGDDLDESNETFTVDLSSPSDASIADDQGIGDDHRRRSHAEHRGRRRHRAGGRLGDAGRGLHGHSLGPQRPCRVRELRDGRRHRRLARATTPPRAAR